jgi:hypothetical protein
MDVGKLVAGVCVVAWRRELDALDWAGVVLCVVDDGEVVEEMVVGVCTEAAVLGDQIARVIPEAVEDAGVACFDGVVGAAGLVDGATGTARCGVGEGEERGEDCEGRSEDGMHCGVCDVLCLVDVEIDRASERRITSTGLMFRSKREGTYQPFCMYSRGKIIRGVVERDVVNKEPMMKLDCRSYICYLVFLYLKPHYAVYNDPQKPETTSKISQSRSDALPEMVSFPIEACRFLALTCQECNALSLIWISRGFLSLRPPTGGDCGKGN